MVRASTILVIEGDPRHRQEHDAGRGPRGGTRHRALDHRYRRRKRDRSGKLPTYFAANTPTSPRFRSSGDALASRLRHRPVETSRPVHRGLGHAQSPRGHRCRRSATRHHRRRQWNDPASFQALLFTANRFGRERGRAPLCRPGRQPAGRLPNLALDDLRASDARQLLAEAGVPAMSEASTSRLVCPAERVPVAGRLEGIARDARTPKCQQLIRRSRCFAVGDASAYLRECHPARGS